MTPSKLANGILQYIHDATAAAVEQYLPDLLLPGYFAGQRISQDFAIDLCVTLAALHEAGYAAIGNRSIVDAIAAVLPQLDGPTIKTFYSYRLAETLQTFGGMQNNPLLAGLDASKIKELAAATDSTSIYNRETDSLSGHPNNYWCVLARCEHARSLLGLPGDDAILKIALERSRQLLLRNPLGFFDDDLAFGGRYDIYSADVLIFVQPMWDLLGREQMLKILATHVGLLESIAMSNGATVCWGRSIGALSLCLTAELSAMGIRHGIGDEGRLIHLASHAFEKFRSGWMRDGLINAHRGKMTDGYRGPQRLLQMTFDCFEKWAWLANDLREVEREPAPITRRELFPERDELIRFDTRPSGVWMFRNRPMEFQLAVVSGWNADYAAAPHSPGLFENPVDSQLYSGSPRVSANGRDYSATGLPAELRHEPGKLTITGQAIRIVGEAGNAPEVIGKRDVTWKAADDRLVIEERWTFDTAPDALSYAIGESATPLKVEWRSDSPHSARTVHVDEMHGFTSAWSRLKRWHEVDFGNLVKQTSTGGTATVSLRAIVTPAIRVAHGPASHDYNRGMYDAMPEPGVIETGFESGIPIGRAGALLEKCAEAGVLHIGWPEHLFGGNQEEALEAHRSFAGGIRKHGIKVAWTMHNRRPHWWPAETGRELYRIWAAVTDAALHHSQWGRDIMVNEYAFQADCRHEIIPHGHFGSRMQTRLGRRELEGKFKLPPCAVRFGILGRYQSEKQIEMMLQAFHEAARPDHQLVISAYKEEMSLHDDPRIFKLPRKEWMTREEIAEHAMVCDVMLAAQTGDTYLTSGMVGDAVGLGLAMIVPEWEFYREIAGNAALYHGNTLDSLRELLAGVREQQIRNCRTACASLQAEYDWANLSPKVYQILRDLVSQHR